MNKKNRPSVMFSEDMIILQDRFGKNKKVY